MRLNEQEILRQFQDLIESLEDAGVSQDVISLLEDALSLYVDQD